MWFICYPDITPVEHLPFYTISVGMHLWQYPTPGKMDIPTPSFYTVIKEKENLLQREKPGAFRNTPLFFFRQMCLIITRLSQKISGMSAGLSPSETVHLHF